MGVIVNWNSVYPTTVDDDVLNFTVLTDNVDDVIVSHPNELAQAVIFLERENTGYKDNLVITGGTNEMENIREIDRVIGSVLFDGEALAHLIPHLRLIGVFNNGGAVGDLKVQLYDMGPPGTPLLPPERRATVAINHSDGGLLIEVNQPLTLSASPGTDLNQIHNVLRIYELRLNLDTVTPGDTGVVHWAGISLGVTQA